MSDRLYQRRQARRIVEALDRGTSGTLLVAATGTGKTRVARNASREYHALTGYPSLHLAPTLETLDQAIRAYSAIYSEEQIGIMHGQKQRLDPNNAVIISTPHTLREPNRYKAFIGTYPQGVGLITCDEAHHFMAPQTMRLVETVRGLGPAAMVLGTTATPERADEKHILDLFPDLSAAYDILDAMHDAYLPDIHPYTVNTGISLASVSVRRDYDLHQLQLAVNVAKRNEAAVQAYVEHGDGASAIAFCAGVEHAEALVEKFHSAGVTAAALHDSLTAGQRRAIVDGYRAGTIKVLAGYNIPLEGLDVDARVGLWLRPTKLEHLYTQGMGRLLRPQPNIAATLGEIHDVEERRALLDRTKGFSIMLELRDDDPRSVRRPTVGIASLLGLPADLKLTGQPVRYTSQRMDMIASRMPERAGLVDSDATIHVLADLAQVHFGAPEMPHLPTALQKSRISNGIPWQPHGPRRYAAPMLMLSRDRIREDSLVLSAYGDLWAVEHARRGVRTPLYATKTFDEAISRAAAFHRENHIADRAIDQIRIECTPADLKRLGAPITVSVDGQTLSVRDAIMTEIAVNPNRYRDRAKLWDRAPLAPPKRIGDLAIAFSSMIKIDMKEHERLVREAAQRPGHDERTSEWRAAERPAEPISRDRGDR